MRKNKMAEKQVMLVFCFIFIHFAVFLVKVPDWAISDISETRNIIKTIWRLGRSVK